MVDRHVTDAAHKNSVNPVEHFAGHNSSSEEASHSMLKELYSVHAFSFDRNKKDSAENLRVGINSDIKGIALVDQTLSQSDKLQQYLDKGGNFSDSEGKRLGAQFIHSLRQESANHRADRAGAQEYAGAENVSETARQKALADNSDIKGLVQKLSDPKISEQDRIAALTQIDKSAFSLGFGIGDQTGRGGKDQGDAVSESEVISADAAALKGANLSPEQRNLLMKDIVAKTGLIANDLNDLPNEVREIQHDNKAIQTGASLETMLQYAMKNPGHANRALQQLKAGLGSLTDGESTGVLDAIKVDRQFDMVNEPVYNAANARNNKEENGPILEFTNPYK